MSNNLFKPLNIVKARLHTDEMENRFKEEIKESIDDTTVYDADFECVGTKRFPKTHLTLLDADSVTAVMNFSEDVKRCAVLNFASYKHPGGKFLEGSNAQEECLCHESNLYNVISTFNDYYEWNNKHLNKALYLNRALYSPSIIFGRENVFTKCDVITCASPNFRAYSRYNKDFELNDYVMRNRIRYVLSIAADKKVDTLIIGAFGCGVFAQDPHKVALFFEEFLTTDFANTFEHVVIAIPDKSGKNYKEFEKVFKDWME